jgi:hypothetical protein
MAQLFRIGEPGDVAAEFPMDKIFAGIAADKTEIGVQTRGTLLAIPIVYTGEVYDAAAVRLDMVSVLIGP